MAFKIQTVLKDIFPWYSSALREKEPLVPHRKSSWLGTIGAAGERGEAQDGQVSEQSYGL
jgi:hypothetical protein